MIFTDKVYLASASPRRRELLGNLFNDVSYLTSKLSEPTWQNTQTPKEYLSHCLSIKWKGAELALSDEFLQKARPKKSSVLVADTTVVLNKRLLEKPADARDAAWMLSELSGKTHVVRTGLILGRFEAATLIEKAEFFVESLVTFYPLSGDEIQAYVKSGAPLDKAGAYGFQDMALRFVKKLEGSYLNVVGLPLLELERQAVKMGVT